MLDYCDLELGGRSFKDIHVFHACQRIYKHHGFATNPWDRTIQYKRVYLDRDGFAAGTGFAASFHFEIGAGGIPDELEVAVERAEAYVLTVNGRQVAWSGRRHWLDHLIGTADIAAYVREGDNTLRIDADPFDLRLELEPVYLFGSFALPLENRKFMMRRQGMQPPLALGSIVEQGYPFYAQSVSYGYEVGCERLPEKALLQLNEWVGTVCRIEVNGVPSARLGIGTGRQADITSLLRAGRNQITIRVVGSLKNLLGPHHDRELPRNTAWPAMWKKAPLAPRPPADEYDFIGYGLYEAVELIWCEREPR